jgi:hypothetical protein
MYVTIWLPKVVRKGPTEFRGSALKQRHSAWHINWEHDFNLGGGGAVGHIQTEAVAVSHFHWVKFGNCPPFCLRFNIFFQYFFNGNNFQFFCTASQGQHVKLCLLPDRGFTSPILHRLQSNVRFRAAFSDYTKEASGSAQMLASGL